MKTREIRREAEREPRSLDELLDREERAAWDGIQVAVAGLGEDLVRATRLRERVRAHPWLALASAAALGALAAPLAVRAVRALADLGGRGAASVFALVRKQLLR